MNSKTFKQLYVAEVRKPTPAQKFIAEVAKITCKTELTVRMWIYGRQSPDDLTKYVIAQHFGGSVKELFPEKSKKS